ncbi:MULTISPECIES: ATP-binding protein [Streptomyces]|uniref:ATP-binding protein n=1 Tax=Streptomyces TaxID=1883 RepID=UPI00240E6DC0|nr:MULTISPECIES: ATP-binding protein [Streptomyces]WFB88763.1 ATP-binding protein [Streptomyces olivaceus]WGK51366.1 ATP-binding protein [Streptomyces sp. B146]
MNALLSPLPRRHVLTLPAAPSAIRLARETAEQAFAEWGVQPQHPTVGPALLILSELVTNSVRHAAPPSAHVTVVYSVGPDCLAFGVHDRHPYRPVLRTATVENPTGGLATVMELTTDLGGTAVVRGDCDEQGKSIWITLPL